MDRADGRACGERAIGPHQSAIAASSVDQSFAGASQLFVVANGIASAPFNVTVAGEVTYWISPSPIPGPAGTHWSRGADTFTAADVDGDHHVELLVANNGNGYTGILKWNGSAMAPHRA